MDSNSHNPWLQAFTGSRKINKEMGSGMTGAPLLAGAFDDRGRCRALPDGAEGGPLLLIRQCMTTGSCISRTESPPRAACAITAGSSRGRGVDNTPAVDATGQRACAG